MENLDTLDLSEVKSLCKKYGIGVIGDKKELIKKLNYYLEPIQDVLNTHSSKNIPADKKIVGVKINEQEKINKINKLKGKFLYYSLGYQYYLVDKTIDF
jgi:hypothetical protein